MSLVVLLYVASLKDVVVMSCEEEESARDVGNVDDIRAISSFEVTPSCSIWW